MGRLRLLQQISIQIRNGEIIGLIGENGAGKSTLLKCLCGIIRPSKVSFTFAGRNYRGINVNMANNLGIVCIPQEFNLINELQVYENIFLGRELHTPLGLLDQTAMRIKTQQLLEELGTEIPAERAVKDLSVADKQLVEIAKALSQSCRLLIMDEPTTVLNDNEVDNLFQIMERIHKNGTVILYVAH